MDDEEIGGLTRRLAAEALAAGDPTGWFEPLYAGAEEAGGAPPWAHAAPRWPLRAWAQERGLRGDGRSALVVGAGLGADAEYVAGLGFATIAFDISPTAVRLANARTQHGVRYETADLLALPDAWRGAFDLVVECLTVQALPDPPRAAAIAAIPPLVAPGGTLIVVASAADDDAAAPDAGPPWPLTRAEIDAFATDGLETIAVEHLADPDEPRWTWWRAEYRRPPGPAPLSRPARDRG